MQFKNETERQKHYIHKCRELVRIRERKSGRKLTACVVTFGCQMNFKDSEKFMGILSEIGYELTDSERADIVLYNTCTVRENANFKIYGRLGYLSKIKEKNPSMIIGLCGCMMQEPDIAERIRKSYPFVDLIFGTHNIFLLPELLYERFLAGHTIENIWDEPADIVEDLPSIRKYPFKSGVNIMFGCNNFCSYCIVPYVRGRERSRSPEDILHEIKQLADTGVVEVMLLGQNVNSYGKTLEPKISFAGLLREVEQIPGIQRIRFMTSHPKDLSDELIDVMSHSKKICRHMHLPLQSGSTKILKLMNRHYTKENYIELVDKLRCAMPDIAITTDIIVGFPKETEKDFLETLDVVQKVRFDAAFTFIYSKRSGTPAASMDGQILDETVKERFNRLLTLVNSIVKEKTDEQTGQLTEVLVEGLNQKLEGYVTGRLNTNMLVHFPGNKEMIGHFVNVRLKESKGFYYLGEMVD